MRATPAEWKACRGVFGGHPCFILGNGPDLPEKLGCLDDFFSIGVNRIQYRYDPTFVCWFDANVEPDIARYLCRSKAVPWTNQEINWQKYNGLDCIGNTATPATEPCNWPTEIPVTGSSGVSSAYWAMSFGFGPIYCVGMGGGVDVGGITDFYGLNPYHERATMARIRRVTSALYRHHGERVFPIADQQTLEDVCDSLRPAFGMGREWFLEQLRLRHASIRTRQRPESPRGRFETIDGALQYRGEPHPA